jgi:hypothetical protein
MSGKILDMKKYPPQVQQELKTAFCKFCGVEIKWTNGRKGWRASEISGGYHKCPAYQKQKKEKKERPPVIIDHAQEIEALRNEVQALKNELSTSRPTGITPNIDHERRIVRLENLFVELRLLVTK